MNRVQPDNVHSTIFTPQEYQVELIDSCMQRNTVAVLASRSTRTFLVTMVTRELSYHTRSLEEGGNNQYTLIIGKAGPKLVKAGEAIQQNTNLAVATYTSIEQVNEWQDDKWVKVLLDSQVIVMTYDVLEKGFEIGFLDFKLLNLFVITDAHLMLSSNLLNKILSSLSPTCRTLAMTSPVLSLSPSPAILNSLLAYLRRMMGCVINTSSEIVTILRYVNKPHERLIICANPSNIEMSPPEKEVRRLTQQAMSFLEHHRYDLVEVYGPEYAEFCIGVPDPIKEPKQILQDFINVLDSLGLWCADRAALYSLVEIEKLKKKTAYDRHYLLLCLVFSVMARVRAVIESAFENYSELQQIVNFSTPKVLRLIDILRQIRPMNFVDPRKRRERAELSNAVAESSEKTNADVHDESTKDMNPVPTSSDEKVSPQPPPKECCSCSCKLSRNHSGSLNSIESDLSQVTDVSISIHEDKKDNKMIGVNVAATLAVSLGSSVEFNCTNGNEEGCETGVTLSVPNLGEKPEVPENIESTRNLDKNSNPVIIQGNEDKKAPLASDFTGCDSLLLVKNDLTDGCMTRTCCDSSSLSTSHMNEGLSTSQESLHDSFQSCSPLSMIADDLDQLSPTPHSLLTSVDEDSRQFTSALDVSCHSSVPGPSPTQEGSEKEEHADSPIPGRSKAETCLCPCHQPSPFNSSLPSESTLLTPILNGCISEEEAALHGLNSDQPEAALPTCSKKPDILQLPSNGIDNEITLTNSMEGPFDENRNGVLNGCIKEVCEDSLHSSMLAAEDSSDCIVPAEGSCQPESSSAHSQPPKTSEAIAMADTLAQFLPTVNKTRKKREDVKEKVKVHNPEDPDSVCGLLFVQHRTTAKIIYRLLKELSAIGGEFSWLFPQYTVELCKNATEDPRAAEAEHKKQEEVLRRFRHHECNILVSTAVLEEGIDIPNCNLIVRFDPAPSYSSYVYSRGRAKGVESFYLHLVVKHEEDQVFNEMASYAAYEQILLTECENVDEGTNTEITAQEADTFAAPYVTSAGASVSMATAIALLNKYCAKLPSDTFTRLTAMWSLDSEIRSERGTEPPELFQCTILLPINSPLKGYTKGYWMKKKSLAKMSGALACCKKLHEIGELNDNLLPVGKENMQLDAHLCPPLPDDEVSEGMPRPGSTKRRQYYYKKVAECLVGEEPSPSLDLWVYKLDMVLSCPIPDEQNTRGRKIYRPETSSRSLGLVATKPIPPISGFPVFTRSGEVMVNVKEMQCRIRITEDDLEGLKCFHMFTFTHVLRLEKYPIRFQPANAKTTFFIAPLLADRGPGDMIDWDFVKVIQARKDHKPTPPIEEVRQNFKFNHSLYQDAVVMPWYRNQDQPQYFYVAEICSHLHPQSDFPDTGFESFEKYYLTKYGLQICNLQQPLLDVDHTSGRLNLLTPRHVNRKGVALPTTSEETKKAKRESLRQKQILVPELCTIHPFPASLWRKAVCLPTILYRVNGLLLADELRVCVTREIGLGMINLPPGFEWPNLDFGWTLADVLARSSDPNKKEKEELKGASVETRKEKTLSTGRRAGDQIPPKVATDSEGNDKTKPSDAQELEIGTWSNDMALHPPLTGFDSREGEDDFEIESFDPTVALPDNLTMLEGNFGDDIEGELGADWGTGLTERKARVTTSRPAKENNGDGLVRVGSPSNFESDGWDAYNGGLSPMFGPYGTTPAGYYYDYGDDFDGFESDQEEEEEEDDFEGQSKVGASASWEDQGKRRGPPDKASQSDEEEEVDWTQECLFCPEEDEEYFAAIIAASKEELRQSKKYYLAEDKAIVIEKACRKKKEDLTHDSGSQTDNKVLLDMSLISNRRQTASHNKHKVANVEPEQNPGVEDHSTKETLRMDKATQTDVVSFTTNSDPEIHCKVDRQKTLAEVKVASENLICTVDLLEKIKGTLCVGDSDETESLVKNDDTQESDQTSEEKDGRASTTTFSFDEQPDLKYHAGPSPSILLQALTMSNANDGVNLERLETIGDSYLKYAITNYLYCTYTQKHEGKLSYLRSKQVSNLNLYRLGKRKGLGVCMVATKFEPHDNWLPPGYFVPRELEEALIDSGVPAGHWNMADFPGLHDLGSDEIRRLVQERSEQIKQSKAERLSNELITISNPQDFIPYNLLTQHSIPDKSISDCVEALIGVYLTTCGPRGALLFMSWLGIQVLPSSIVDTTDSGPLLTYHQLVSPPSPLDACPFEDSKEQLELLLSGYHEFEKKIGYVFRDRSYLLQAFTHASYYRNRLTDCYQRLEFLGDAVLDYLITRHFFEDKRQHSPGSLTDLRSALVNNTIFACLAVKFEFHKYFRHFSPGLDRVVRDFVRMQEENGHKINEEYYFMEEEECEAAEDIEVPKALGDMFESVAGAIFLDSGGSLDVVWRVYYFMMKNEIEQFSGVVPKSPIRELLETEPETAKFGRPERLVDGKVRVSVEVFGKGSFSGVARNYRIAKSTAAKRALRHLKKLQAMAGSDNHQGFL